MELVQLCIDLNVVLSRAYIKPNYNSFIYFITAILTKFYGYKYNPIKQYYINIFNIYEFSMPRQKNGEQKAILLKALMKTMHHSGYHQAEKQRTEGHFIERTYENNAPFWLSPQYSNKNNCTWRAGCTVKCKFNLIISCVYINPQIFAKVLWR